METHWQTWNITVEDKCDIPLQDFPSFNSTYPSKQLHTTWWESKVQVCSQSPLLISQGLISAMQKKKIKLQMALTYSTHQAFTGYFVNNFLILKSK